MYVFFLFLIKKILKNVCYRVLDDALDVTSQPDDPNLAVASSSSLTQSKLPLSSHAPSKFAQLEVELGGIVTLQCPQGLFDFPLLVQSNQFIVIRVIRLLVTLRPYHITPERRRCWNLCCSK